MSGGTIEGPTVVIGADASRVETALSGLKSQFSSFGSELSGISNGFNLDNVASQFDRVAGGMQKMGAAMSLMGVPMGLLAKESIGMFADLESQTQRNTALLGGAKAEYEEILALSKELGASTPFDALEIGAGIESLAAAGYSLKEIQSAMPTVAEMAIATGEDLGSMSEILIATLSSYGEGADKAAMYGDKLATVANISSAGIGDFGESMKYVGAVANAFGVDIDELGSSIATLADNNLKGALAGTGLREIITTLANPTAKVRTIFESFGLTMDELNPKTNDFIDILAKMKDANVSSEAMMAAFGDRAGPAAVILLEQIDKLKENYKTLLTESDGMLKEFSGKMRDTLGFVMDEMGGTISNIMIEIGEGLKPIVEEIGAWLNENQQTLIDFAKNAVDGLTPFVTKFMDLAKKLMDWFNSLPKDLQSKIAGLTGLGGAMATIVGPLLLLGSLPVSGIAKIAGALKELFSLGNAAGGIAGAGKAAASVVPLVRSLAQLAETTPKIAGVTQYIAPIGPSAAGAASQVGLLSSALVALGPALIVGAGAVAGAFVAYQTNFADFRTNVDNAIEHVNNAANLIDRGQYQQAGRELANAVGDGFATAKDLIVKGIPDAAVFAYELDSQMRVAIGDMSGGFGAALREMVDGALASAGAAFEQFAINGAAFAKSFSESLRNGDWEGAAADAAGKFKDSFYTNGKIDAGKLLDGVDSLTSKLQPALDMITLISNPFGGAASVLGGESGNLLDGYFNPEKYKKTSDEIEKFERAVAKSLQNAGTEVKTFADKSSADLNNAMSKWQDAFEKSGKSLEEWTESLKKSGDYSQFIADMDAFAAKYPELADKAGGAANVMKQLDFKPVQFEDGSIFYAYENGVLTPIVDNPIKIMMELNDYENDMRSAYEIYLDYKSQIENAPIMVQMMTSGDVNTSDTSAWKWVADDPNSKGRNIPGETNTQNATQNGTEAAAPVIAEETGKSVAESLAKERGWNYKGSPDVAMAERFLAENPEFAEKYQAELKAAAEETTEETKKSGDKIVKSLEELKTEAYNKAQESFIDPTTDTKYQFNKDTGQYEKYTMADKLAEEKAKADQKAIEAKTDEQKASEAYNKKIQDAIHQMGKWDIQDKYDKRDIENDKPNMMDYDSIDAYNKALSSYSDKLDKLTNSRAEKEELLAYDLGITVEELRNLAAGHKNVTSSGEKLVSTFNTIANIDFSKLTNPFAPQQTGTGTPLSDAELTAIMRAKMPYASESDFAGIVSQQGGIKALAKSWGIIDESGRRIGEYTSETTDKLEKSSELLKSVSDIIGDDLSPGFDRATKYIEEFKKITGDDTDYSDENQKTLALLLNAYKDASDLQDKYEDVLSDSNYLLDEQRDITDKYNDILRLVGLTGIDTTQSLEGLPPAIRAIVEAIMALVNGVKVNSDTRTSGLETPDKNPNKSYIGEIDAESDALFKKIQQDFKNVQLAYDSGKLSQADYLKQLKELSVEADVLSHDPSALKGAQREAIQRFEETIQEQFRRDYAGTGAKGIKNYNPDASLKSAINDLNSQSYPIGKSIKETGTEAKPTTPQINTLNSAFEKIGLTGSGLTDVLSNVNNALSDHHANIQESQDYLKQYNEAAGENIKYTKDQEGQTKDLMNSLGMLGIAQNMYNTYMQEGILDSTESAHVQEALAAATKMMGDAGIDANTNLAGLPGALQALASAAQAAMSQISSAIAMANAQITNVRKVGDWTLQTMSGITPMAPSTPTNFKFASGGPVTENGPAYLHQGEYVLRRDEVNRLTSGGMTINLSINMSNSKFGNAEMAKTLPKRIASEMNKSLKRYGV